jgi:hypothetical protein
MEAHDAGDVLAEIVAALAAGLAAPAGLGAVHDHRIAAGKARHALAHRDDLAGRLDAHHLGHLALGEGHAAKAPHVEVIERERPHPHLHLAGIGRGRSVDVVDPQVAVAVKLEGAHG